MAYARATASASPAAVHLRATPRLERRRRLRCRRKRLRWTLQDGRLTGIVLAHTTAPSFRSRLISPVGGVEQFASSTIALLPRSIKGIGRNFSSRRRAHGFTGSCILRGQSTLRRRRLHWRIDGSDRVWFRYWRPWRLGRRGCRTFRGQRRFRACR